MVGYKGQIIFLARRVADIEDDQVYLLKLKKERKCFIVFWAETTLQRNNALYHLAKWMVKDVTSVLVSDECHAVSNASDAQSRVLWLQAKLSFAKVV